VSEQTDQDPRIIGHPFRPLVTNAGVWPDICGYRGGDFPCGFSRAEHADQGEVTPIETP
jgi:hypothetical protein